MTFNCSAIGNPVPKITWMKDGKTVGSEDTLSFETKRYQSGKYWCSADNGLGGPVNVSADLNVLCEYDDIILIVIVILCVYVMAYMVCRFGCNLTRAEIEQFVGQIRIFWICREIMVCSRRCTTLC